MIHNLLHNLLIAKYASQVRTACLGSLFSYVFQELAQFAYFKVCSGVYSRDIPSMCLLRNVLRSLLVMCSCSRERDGSEWVCVILLINPFGSVKSHESINKTTSLELANPDLVDSVKLVARAHAFK